MELLINEGVIDFFSLYEQFPDGLRDEYKTLSKEEYERIVRRAIHKADKFKCNIKVYDNYIDDLKPCGEFYTNKDNTISLDVSIGTLVFYKDKLYSNIILHECAHVIFELFKRKQQKVNDRLILIKNTFDEELFLRFLDSLYYSVICYLFDSKLIEVDSIGDLYCS